MGYMHRINILVLLLTYAHADFIFMDVTTNRYKIAASQHMIFMFLLSLSSMTKYILTVGKASTYIQPHILATTSV